MSKELKTSERAKLTKAQRRFLDDCAALGEQYAVRNYPPAERLTVLGFIVRREGLFGGIYCRITEAGLKALEASQ